MRISVFSVASIALVASSHAQDVPPYAASPSVSRPAAPSTQSSAATGGGWVSEDFETFAPPLGGAVGVGATLDVTSVTSGQGPGLVKGAATYSSNAGTQLVWNDATYFGLPTRTIESDGPTLTITYDRPMNSTRFSLLAFNAYPDVATVSIFDSNGVPLYVSPSIAVSGPTPVSFEHHEPDMKSITISGTAYSWSPILDDHQYRTCQTWETFQRYAPPTGGAIGLGQSTLDSLTVANGQGPGLVTPGVTYTSDTGAQLQWNDAGYFGLTTRKIMSRDSTLHIVYDPPAYYVGLWMSAFDGYPDVATVWVYDTSGNKIFGYVDVPIPGAIPPVPYYFASQGGIGAVTITGSAHGWSPLLDDHSFSRAGELDWFFNGPALAGGPPVNFTATAEPGHYQAWTALVCLSLGDGSASGGIRVPRTGGLKLMLDPDALFNLWLSLPAPPRSVTLAECDGASTTLVQVPQAAPVGVKVYYAGVELGFGTPHAVTNTKSFVIH